MPRLTALKRILMDEGRRQTWLAEVTGIERSDLNRMVNRGMEPTREEATAIAAALGRTVDEVFPGLCNDECAA